MLAETVESHMLLHMLPSAAFCSSSSSSLFEEEEKKSKATSDFLYKFMELFFVHLDNK
jgi:hypothetical protein